MTPERWKQIEEIFESALGREPEERAAFIREACSNDEALRREIESLLAHQQPTGHFISTLVHQAAELLPHQKSLSGGDARFIPGAVLAGRYRIIGPLGKGGMGEVYRADDLKLGQPVALKFLPENLASDAAMLQRFHREVRIARQISHPNVCRVFDISEVKGQHFLSMEYIDGEDLASLLRRIGRLPADKAVEIARQLCAGLAAAHEEGVLHRDLKPANVMIDGRGKARITDFGLAGLAGEFQGHELRAGTPAYMAPEQLAGKEVSVKSDLYSLGLVLYEIFTGKKAFEASTLEELIRQHESSAPRSMSDYVKEVDPLIERVILRCLERDPRSRPASVTQVAAALPGGDPLAAALAAGETPSPEMVAAAPKEGALRPAVAAACLAAVIGALALIVLGSEKVKLINRVTLDKSPEVLADRASNIIKKLGYSDPPADTSYGFNIDQGFVEYANRQAGQYDLWDKIASGQPLTVFFWYRQSPRYLETPGATDVSLLNPPMNVSNMASVILDPRGRLIEFNAVPSQLEESQSAPRSHDWSILFAEAGLEISNFTSTESKWVPASYADARAAWEGVLADHPEIPVRVEAAAYRSKPVYFQVIPPWELPYRQEQFRLSTGRMAAGALIFITFIVSGLGSVLLARRNLRLGRGDRRGAFKLALFVFAVELSGLLIGADHVPTLGGEADVLLQAVTWALFLSVFFWLLYIALEPYVRRLWPNLIISWNRLLAGGLRDPLVGRDVLIGGLLGFGHTLAIYFMTLLPQWLGMFAPPNSGGDPNSSGPRALAAHFLADSIVDSILTGLGYMFLVLLFYIVLRKKWLAAAGLWVMLFSVLGLAFASFGPAVLWVGPAIIATAYTITVSRLGLLASMAFHLFFTLSFHYPITADFSKWYAGSTLFSVSIVLGLAIYGFYTSLAGQPLFRGEVLKD